MCKNSKASCVRPQKLQLDYLFGLIRYQNNSNCWNSWEPQFSLCKIFLFQCKNISFCKLHDYVSYCFLESKFLFIDLFLLQEIVGYLSFFSGTSINLSVCELSPFSNEFILSYPKEKKGKKEIVRYTCILFNVY